MGTVRWSSDESIKLLAAATWSGGAGAEPGAIPECSHHVTLGRPVGSGSCAVVFAVTDVERVDQASATSRSSKPSLVAKVGMSGEESYESSIEAKILNDLPRHINIIGFHGNFCTVERNEALELHLGKFATRTLSRRQQARSVTKQVSATKKEEMRPMASDAERTSLMAELDIQPLIYNFSLFERCSLSLRELLYFQTLTESELACAMSDIFRGLAFIHKHGVLHRDVTDGNLLVADGGLRIVLADFDMSVKTQGTGQVPWTCGTPGFIAPEVLKNGRGSAKSDIFGAGVVAFLAACGKHPFWREDIQDMKDAARATMRDEPDFWGGRVLRRSSKCLSFVDSLLQKEVDDRPTAKQALCAPWLLSAGASPNLCAAVQRHSSRRAELEDEEEEEEEEEEIPHSRSVFARAVRALIPSSKSTSASSKKASKEKPLSLPPTKRSFWPRLWRKRAGDLKFSQIAPA